MNEKQLMGPIEIYSQLLYGAVLGILVWNDLWVGFIFLLTAKIITRLLMQSLNRDVDKLIDVLKKATDK